MKSFLFLFLFWGNLAVLSFCKICSPFFLHRSTLERGGTRAQGDVYADDIDPFREFINR